MTGAPPEPTSRFSSAGSPRNLTMIIVGIVVLAIALTLVFVLIDGSSGDDPSTTSAPNGAVVLPQNPSLKLIDVEGTWQVENDGNVTMSQIEVRDASETVICELGTLAPDEAAACETADSASDVTAFGLGPQGQEVKISSD